MNQSTKSHSELHQKDVQLDPIDNWFSEMIDHLKVDHFMLKTKTAPKEKADLYDAFINKNDDKIVSQLRSISSQHYIKALVYDYINELKSSNKTPIKLALGISDSKILVWSEIEDNDDTMEDILLLTEAKINGKYYSNGFYINSTIIEKSDNIPVPPHYQPIIE